jgi:hypothetical protein
MKRASIFLAAALCALLPDLARAQPQDQTEAQTCPTPITGPALAQQFRLLSWKETNYVIQREPGMKKVYDALPPNLKAQAQASPAAFPWDRVAANRSQDTLDRVAALVRDARLQTTIDSFAPLPWSSLRAVLARDAEFQVWVDSPKGTPLENAAVNPHAFEWRNLLTTRDTCQLTTLLAEAKAQPASATRAGSAAPK